MVSHSSLKRPKRTSQPTFWLAWLFSFVVGTTAACKKAPPPAIDPAKAPWLLDPNSQIKGLTDQDFRIRGLSAFNLGNMGPKGVAALPALEKLAKEDPNAKVRERAQEAIAKIRPASGG
jgi:hypothetical protein